MASKLQLNLISILKMKLTQHKRFNANLKAKCQEGEKKVHSDFGFTRLGPGITAFSLDVGSERSTSACELRIDSMYLGYLKPEHILNGKMIRINRQPKPKVITFQPASHSFSTIKKWNTAGCS